MGCARLRGAAAEPRFAFTPVDRAARTLGSTLRARLWRVQRRGGAALSSLDDDRGSACDGTDGGGPVRDAGAALAEDRLGERAIAGDSHAGDGVAGAAAGIAWRSRPVLAS